MWRGLRLLETPLQRAREAGIPIRVITTTYIGGTEREALDRLVRDFGAEVRIQYDAARTRLHAKAWLFRRNTGFDTAYVGSSNLSTSALLEGVEWNVRLSASATPTLLTKFEATFDSYWHASEFERYDPDRDRDRLDDALAAARGDRAGDPITLSISGLDVTPFAYQQEILDAIEVERRVHDRHRNLVVAATGTGKTVIAALDYRRLCLDGQRPRLLFVAHRREILEQSLRTYREVLADGAFGELYVGGSRPERWQHVFASVQSLTAYGVNNIPADAFEIVVIDEFHHAEARTYRRILDQLKPAELLRSDRNAGTSRRCRCAVLLRWPHGSRAAVVGRIGCRLAVPVPLLRRRGRDRPPAVGLVSRRLRRDATGQSVHGERRAGTHVLRQLRDKVADVGAMRALGFCVSVAHAEYMARVFNDAGITARWVSGRHSATTARPTTALRARDVHILFAVDLFNEGVDLPAIDMILLLRPTESATILLQRSAEGCVELATRRSSPSSTSSATTVRSSGSISSSGPSPATRRGLEREIQNGFPFLPSGCQILMDRQSQSIVLDNIRAQIANRWQQMVAELRSYGDHHLGSFLPSRALNCLTSCGGGHRGPPSGATLACDPPDPS